MKNCFVLLPRDFSRVSKPTVGVFGAKQLTLLKLHFSIPKTAIIPLSTLQAIADANTLTKKLGLLLKETNFHDPVSVTHLQKSVKNIITRSKIPSPILQELHQVYHDYFLGQAVSVFSSNNSTNSVTTKKTTGDTNFFLTLLEEWSQIVLTHILQTKQKEIHTALFTSPLVVREYIVSAAHGTAFTKHPRTGVKTTVYIVSNQTDHANHESEYSNSYEVDIRTWNVIKKKIGLSPKKTSLFGASKQSRHHLSNSQIVEIAHIVNSIKKQHLDHKKVSWALLENNIAITAISDFAEYEHLDSEQKSITQVYASAGNPQRSATYTDLPIAGIGLLKSEYSILKYGTHPHALVRGHKRNLLKHSLIHTLQTFNSFPQIKKILYRSFDFPSNELSKLEHATTYESVEQNPWVGTRGAYKQLSQPDLFDLELETLKEYCQHSSTTIGLLLPFVRSPEELQRIIVKVAEAALPTPQFELWWQVTTPENILNASAYPVKKIDGISIQVDTLLQLLLGTDPTNSLLQEHYSAPIELLETLLETFIAQIQKSKKTARLEELPILLQMEQYNPAIVALAVKLGLTGVTVRPAVAPLAKACIIDYEAAPLLEKKNTVSNKIVL